MKDLWVRVKNFKEIVGFRDDQEIIINNNICKCDISFDISYPVIINGLEYKSLYSLKYYKFNEEKMAILVDNEYYKILNDWIKEIKETFNYKINDKVYCSNNPITKENFDICERRYFSNKVGDKFQTFANGRDVWSYQGSYELWDYAISEEDFEMIQIKEISKDFKGLTWL